MISMIRGGLLLAGDAHGSFQRSHGSAVRARVPLINSRALLADQGISSQSRQSQPDANSIPEARLGDTPVCVR